MGCVKVFVNVTTDKCYEIMEWVWPYRESDVLGGGDPYAASKACSELLTSAYYKSFFRSNNVYVATARAGNVIGGGDWAKDRLVPDFFRCVVSGEPIFIRSPNAVRPWQHVLEPVLGYVMLARHLYDYGDEYSGAWNFGPNYSDAKSVSWMVETLQQLMPLVSSEIDTSIHQTEALMLTLDSSKARLKLGWQQVWDIRTALAKTFEWHAAFSSGENVCDLCNSQINSYMGDLDAL